MAVSVTLKLQPTEFDLIRDCLSIAKNQCVIDAHTENLSDVERKNAQLMEGRIANLQAKLK